MSLNDLLTHAADLLEGEARALKECHSRRDGEWHLARPADHSAKRDHDDMMQTAAELRSLLTRPEARGETPRTDAARRAHARWCEYAKQYGNMPEAMEQAPPEADPFYIAEELERELSAKREGFVWVPVSERLPEKPGYYLIAQSGYLDPKHGVTSSYYNPDDGDDPYWSFAQAENAVTHWMEFPEPPIAAATKDPA